MILAIREIRSIAFRQAVLREISQSDCGKSRSYARFARIRMTPKSRSYARFARIRMTAKGRSYARFARIRMAAGYVSR